MLPVDASTYAEYYSTPEYSLQEKWTYAMHSMDGFTNEFNRMTYARMSYIAWVIDKSRIQSIEIVPIIKIIEISVELGEQYQVVVDYIQYATWYVLQHESRSKSYVNNFLT